MGFSAGDIVSKFASAPPGEPGIVVWYGVVERTTPKSFLVRWGDDRRWHRQRTDRVFHPHHVPDDIRRALAAP